MATKVKLLEKAISGNRKSLYLDFYPAIINLTTGKPTRREFLGYYIYAEIDKSGKKIKRSPADLQHNKETYEIAKYIRQKRENTINKPEIYTEFEAEQIKIKEKGQQNFVEYYAKLADKRKGSNFDNWISAYYYLEEFTNGELKFCDLNVPFCNDFKDYLLTTKSRKSDKACLSTNSAVSYFNKVKAAMKQAFKDGVLQVDINSKVEPIKNADTKREFLTIEELNKAIKVECKYPIIKKAAIFSAVTGLRFSDIHNLEWGNIALIEGSGYYIDFKIVKSKRFDMLPISELAYSMLGEQKGLKDKVFEGLDYSNQNESIQEWITSAGINKVITFHNFRHTYAVLQLANGTDIYTLKDLLAHKNVQTTQIYGKILNKAKRAAADKIKVEF